MAAAVGGRLTSATLTVAAAIPEAATGLLMAVGLALLVPPAVRRRRVTRERP